MSNREVKQFERLNHLGEEVGVTILLKEGDREFLLSIATPDYIAHIQETNQGLPPSAQFPDNFLSVAKIEELKENLDWQQAVQQVSQWPLKRLEPFLTPLEESGQ